MDKEYFLNAGIQPPAQVDPTMHAWNSFSSAQELNCSSSDQTLPCFFNPNWDKQTDHYSQFDSALSSMISSPVAPNSAMPAADPFAFRELIRKMGPTCNSGDMSQPFPAAGTTSYVGNSSCYSTPLNSPPKLHVPILNDNLPNLRNSAALNPALPALSADPGFAERAAKFSCFGSRSFNDRTSQFEHNNAGFSRVSSSPLLKEVGSPIQNKNSGQPQMEMRTADGAIPIPDKAFSKLPSNRENSNEEPSVSEQAPSGETGLKTPNEQNSRKRKAVSKGKAKIDSSNKGAEPDADANAKRSKMIEANVNENRGVKMEEGKGSDDKANQKPPEPPKDYIHVRARRGQATDSHSLAERVRREKISERMKLLQDLVPGCNKVTGKALMLDEIINYVQSLQRQVEFLSMKLASVNPRLDNMDTLLSKDVFQPNASLPHPLFPLDSSESALYKKHPEQNPQLHNNNNSMDINTTLCSNVGLQLAPLDGFTNGLPQFPAFCEDDLHSIIQMSHS